MAHHTPVLLSESLHWLAPAPGGRYLDGTLGLGGHPRAILEAAPQVQVLCIDRDQEALEEARTRLENFGESAHFARTSYSTFPDVLAEVGWERVDGALLDLGVSSLHLDDPARGFSFLTDGPLDMRMDSGQGTPPARQIVNQASVEVLKRIIRDYGEEPMAGRIARKIVTTRENRPITTTLELAGIVESAYPPKRRATSRTHPATKTFQALRIAVNQELDELKSFLATIPDFLSPGGRVVVISFHSLEDRLVKHSFRNEARGCQCPPRMPVCTCGLKPRLRVLTKKPVLPTREEIESNPRSRSAKLRAAERLQEAGS